MTNNNTQAQTTQAQARSEAERYLQRYLGAEEWQAWMTANEGEEEICMAAQINQWAEEEDEEDPIPTEIKKWAQQITNETQI